MLKLFKQRSFHAFNQGIGFGLLKVRRLNTKKFVWFKVPEQGSVLDAFVVADCKTVFSLSQ